MGVEIIRIKAVLSSTGLELELSLAKSPNHNLAYKTAKYHYFISSERPKRAKSVSAETEISAKLTESSAEISAEN